MPARTSNDRRVLSAPTRTSIRVGAAPNDFLLGGRQLLDLLVRALDRTPAGIFVAHWFSPHCHRRPSCQGLWWEKGFEEGKLGAGGGLELTHDKWL